MASKGILVFFGTIDVAHKVKNLSNLLEVMVQEVGLKNVINVVTSHMETYSREAYRYL